MIGRGGCNAAIVGLSCTGGSSSVLVLEIIVEGIRCHRAVFFDLFSGLIDVTVSSRESG